MNNKPIIDMQCNEITGRMMRPVAYIKSDFIRKKNEILEITYFLGN